MPFATTWMELEGVMLSKISQSEKDNYHMISLIVEFKKQNRGTEEKIKQDEIREGNKPKQTLNQRKQTEIAGGQVGRKMG